MKPEEMKPEEMKAYLLSNPPFRLTDEQREERDQLNKALDDHILGYQRELHEMLEEACRRAQQTGVLGVKVTYIPATISHKFEITSDVPFGEIHWFTDHGPVAAAQFGPNSDDDRSG